MLMSSLCRLQFHEWSCCQLCSYLNSSVTFVQHSWILSSHLITLSVLLTLNQLYPRNQPYVETVYGIPSNNHLWTCQATMLETLPWESISCYVAASALAETPTLAGLTASPIISCHTILAISDNRCHLCWTYICDIIWRTLGF